MVINQNVERVEKVELFMTLCSTCSNFNDMIAMIYKKRCMINEITELTRPTTEYNAYIY